MHVTVKTGQQVLGCFRGASKVRLVPRLAVLVNTLRVFVGPNDRLDRCLRFDDLRDRRRSRNNRYRIRD